jgi:VWFA-related protein
LAFSASAQTPAPTPPDEDASVENIFVEEIKLNISAFDLNGKFFSGVTTDDLVITEDGRLHQPTSVRRIPANVLIVLDTGGEMRRAKRIDQTRDTAKKLVSSLLPEDSVAVIQYNDTVEIIAEWTENKAEIFNILNKRLDFGKRSLFYEAIETATAFLQKTPLENRHLVLITDGTDSFNNEAQKASMIRNLLASNISVHVISYTRLEQKELAPDTGKLRKGNPKPNRAPEEIINTMPNGVRDMMNAPRLGSIITDREFLQNLKERQNALRSGENFLSTIAENTNGQFILPETKEEMIEKPVLIAQMIDSSYVVTYTPKRPLKDAPKDEIREVVVTSKRDGLDVFARRKISPEVKN